MSKKRNCKILIVEDEPALQDAYKTILSMQGYEVDTASNGMQASKKIAQYDPDIMLLDIFMPIMDGKTFLQNFDKAQHKELTIIVSSNLSDRDIEKEMLQLGADAFVLKSDMSPTDLVELVKEYEPKHS